jgi:Reverse transcriptase (RNA-dependent DNA polymerase)
MLPQQMANSLGLPERVIQAFANKANHAYKTYFIDKRGGGFREIHHPSKELKALQRWLLHNVIMQWPVHSKAAAYRPNLGIANNAQEHVHSRYLLRMDFQDFFPSITEHDVRTYLERSDGGTKRWDSTDLDLFVALVCRHGCLTIGAPTSPALSNALCFELDRQLDLAANAREVTYTRYADDLFFSTTKTDILKSVPEVVVSILATLDLPAALLIRESKTRHSSKRGRRQVTGLVLRSDDVIGIGRKRKRYIRGLIHKFDLLSPSERRRLSGLLAFARSIEPDFINALIMKFGPERIGEAQKMQQA